MDSEIDQIVWGIERRTSVEGRLSHGEFITGKKIKDMSNAHLEAALKDISFMPAKEKELMSPYVPILEEELRSRRR